MTAAVTFVDTNVLVYAHDRADAVRHTRAVALLAQLWADRTGVVSTQVLSEFYSVATRKLGMPPAEAREIAMQYTQWPVVEHDVPMLAAAMERHERDGVAWWDCLVVEAALRSGAARLASEDLHDGRRFGTLEVVNPFA